jgi:methanogen homocitrate synthase
MSRFGRRIAVKNLFYRKDAWWVSPYNYAAAVANQAGRRGRPAVFDCTMKEWGRDYGASYSVMEARQYFERLADINIGDVVIGEPDSEMTPEAIREICGAFADMTFHMRVRSGKKAIYKAADCGVKNVQIKVPCGYPAWRYELNWEWERAAEHCVENINYAKECNLQAHLALIDIARSRPEDWFKICSYIMKASSPASFCLEDSTGSMLPQAFDSIIRMTKKHAKRLPVHACAYNDFGLALACSLQAIAAGADAVHASINGLGARTGTAALEEIILCRELLLGKPANTDFARLYELCVHVELISGKEIAAGKPFGGLRYYFHQQESQDSAARHPLLHFATNPAFFNRKAQLMPEIPKR